MICLPNSDLSKKYLTFSYKDLSLSMVINLPFFLIPSTRHKAEYPVYVPISRIFFGFNVLDIKLNTLP